MIFGNEYDLSLWYMLKVHNPYRRKAINFVKELPEELLENIRFTYINNGTDHNVGLDGTNASFYKIHSENEPDVYYKFYIMCRNLYIYKVKTINGVDNEVFGLILYPNNGDNIINLDIKQETTLGSITTGQYPDMSFTEVDYNFVRTKYGYKISFCYVLFMNMIELKFYIPTSIKNIPDEMFREDSPKKRLIKLPPKDNN